MCSAELQHKWSDSPVKAIVTNFRVTVKDYVAWHSRIGSLVFFCVLLSIGAVFGVTTTLTAVGYLSNPQSGFLSTGFTAQDDIHSIVSDTEPSRATTVTDPVLISSNTTTSNSTTVIVDELYEERTEAPSTFRAELLLMPHPVDLKPLSDVYHDMSEAELLWRASAGTRRRPRPASVTPKVAYMFLTRGALPLAPLWDRYFKGHGDLYNIYVHAHPNYLPKFSPDSVFYRRNIRSKVSNYVALHNLLFSSMSCSPSLLGLRIPLRTLFGNSSHVCTCTVGSEN